MASQDEGRIKMDLEDEDDSEEEEEGLEEDERTKHGSATAASSTAHPTTGPLRKIEFSGEEDRLRFLLELEFVQTLANPNYLNCTIHSLLGDLIETSMDKAFLNYLKYLEYWRQPQYAKFLVYPYCLHFLELVQHEEFQNELLNPKFAEYIHFNTFYHWRDYKKNRYRDAYLAKQQKASTTAGEQTGAAPDPSQPPAPQQP